MDPLLDLARRRELLRHLTQRQRLGPREVRALAAVPIVHARDDEARELVGVGALPPDVARDEREGAAERVLDQPQFVTAWMTVSAPATASPTPSPVARSP